VEVYEKINFLLSEKNMSKKKFTDIFLSLEPKLRTTGEAPSKSSIYGYLSGRREIKVELIPYIAEALGIKEQDLFNIDLEYATEYNVRYSSEVREIIALLPYAPKNIVLLFKEKLKKYKKEFDNAKLEL